MNRELTLVHDLIQQRTGLALRDCTMRGALETRLAPLIQDSGCGSVTEYHLLLTESSHAATAEWRNIFNEFSVNASSLVRQNKVTGTLIDYVLPEWFQENKNKTLNIWSAACSTGEEPVSIAIALSESGWFDRLEIGIRASDASTVALEKARRGIYSDKRLRTIPDEIREKHYIPVNDGWKVKPEIHDRIDWSVANLADRNEIAGLAAADIIICRNVFIYFTEATIISTLRLFAEYMPPGGYLFTDRGDYFNSLMTKVPIYKPCGSEGLFILQQMA